MIYPNLSLRNDEIIQMFLDPNTSARRCTVLYDKFEGILVIRTIMPSHQIAARQNGSTNLRYHGQYFIR